MKALFTKLSFVILALIGTAKVQAGLTVPVGFTASDSMICAELAGDFHLGYARQLTDKSSLLFDLAF